MSFGFDADAVKSHSGRYRTSYQKRASRHKREHRTDIWSDATAGTDRCRIGRRLTGLTGRARARAKCERTIRDAECRGGPDDFQARIYDRRTAGNSQCRNRQGGGPEGPLDRYGARFEWRAAGDFPDGKCTDDPTLLPSVATIPQITLISGGMPMMVEQTMIGKWQHWRSWPWFKALTCE
jgi:hypothetical protein